jgi:FkbH-like protein
MTVDGEKTVKCLVWDIDNTLWDGTLLEGGEVALRPGIRGVLEELDRRGILMSVASKNEPEDAIAKLREFGIEEYFLSPQIGWGSKADSVAEISRRLNLGLDTFAFIDDLPYEREEVAFHNPEVRTYDASRYLELPGLPEFTPRFVTGDSKLRRQMYMEDIKRNEREESFEGSKDEFLRTLDMELTISPVREGDLERVEELTLRTNQLNSTGATYSYEELTGFIASPGHMFVIAELSDKFGAYGKIGLVLAARSDKILQIKLLLMSCRVMTRGVGSAILAWLINYALAKNLELQADFVSTPRNRIMYITYKLMGFDELSRDGDRCLLRYRGGAKDMPDYLKMTV